MILKRLWPLLLVLLALDFATKKIALSAIPHIQWNEPYPFGGIPIFSHIFSLGISCSLNAAFNTGAAWGMFPGHSGLLFSIRILVIAALLVYLIKKRDAKFSLWLIATGAIGNAIDYSLYGFVVDFIHLNFWGYTFPIFNVADSLISIGAVWLFLTPKKNENPHLQPTK